MATYAEMADAITEVLEIMEMQAKRLGYYPARPLMDRLRGHVTWLRGRAIRDAAASVDDESWRPEGCRGAPPCGCDCRDWPTKDL